MHRRARSVFGHLMMRLRTYAWPSDNNTKGRFVMRKYSSSNSQNTRCKTKWRSVFTQNLTHSLSPNEVKLLGPKVRHDLNAPKVEPFHSIFGVEAWFWVSGKPPDIQNEILRPIFTSKGRLLWTQLPVTLKISGEKRRFSFLNTPRLLLKITFTVFLDFLRLWKRSPLPATGMTVS